MIDLLSPLILLPIAFFLLLLLRLSGEQNGSGFVRDWREAFLLAALIWGMLLVVASEILSPLHGLTRPVITGFWAAAVGILFWNTKGSNVARLGFARLRGGVLSLRLWQQALLIMLAAVAITIFLVGWISPPNNVDSHLYHTARVMHWAQNGSLEHYAAKYHHQLNRPTFAGTAVLHLRTLWGGDQPASAVQWFSMLGSLVAVSAITARLGAGRLGQWGAAVFAATIPMGILQASSTQVDYVTAFWFVTGLYFIVVRLSGAGSGQTDLFVGAAAGLCLLSKTTGYVYILPVLGLYLLARLRKDGARQALFSAGVIALLIVIANAGFWARNIDTYGSPLGGFRRYSFWFPDLDWLDGSTDDRDTSLSPVQGRERDIVSVEPTFERDTAQHAREGSLASTISIPYGEPEVDSELTSGLRVLLEWVHLRLRTVASGFFIHAVTPSSAVNSTVREILGQPQWLLSDRFYGEFDKVAWSHEDTATNPFHMALVGLATAGLIVEGVAKDQRARLAMMYAAMVALSIFLLNSTGFTVWVLRYQLGFFVAAAPLIGWGMDRWLGRKLGLIAASLLLVSAVPWLLLNNTRPLLGMEPWPTRIGSIFSEPPVRVLFANSLGQADEAVLAAEFTEATGCKRLGFQLDSSDLEYPLWWLLRAPQDGTRVRIMNPLERLQELPAPTFEPCVVICTTCGSQSEVAGIPFSNEFGRYRIYVEADVAASRR